MKLKYLLKSYRDRFKWNVIWIETIIFQTNMDMISYRSMLRSDIFCYFSKVFTWMALWRSLYHIHQQSKYIMLQLHLTEDTLLLVIVLVEIQLHGVSMLLLCVYIESLIKMKYHFERLYLSHWHVLNEISCKSLHNTSSLSFRNRYEKLFILSTALNFYFFI